MRRLIFRPVVGGVDKGTNTGINKVRGGVRRWRAAIWVNTYQWWL